MKYTNNYYLIDKYIGEHIKDKRIKMGIPLVDFAGKFNMSKNRFFNYEAGIRTMPLDTYYDVCKALKIDAEKLFKEAQEYMRKETFK